MGKALYGWTKDGKLIMKEMDVSKTTKEKPDPVSVWCFSVSTIIIVIGITLYVVTSILARTN